MSIVLVVPPDVRPFRGYAEPSLPDGYWVVHASVLGDGSGGLMTVDIRFSAIAQPAVSLLWSLEQLLLNHSGDGDREVRMDFGNMDRQPVGSSTGALNKLAHIQLLDIGVTITGVAIPIQDTTPKLFLGSAAKGVAGDLSFDTANLDANSLSVFCQGYFWGPGSINAPGGPQRPLTGLYAA